MANKKPSGHAPLEGIYKTTKGTGTLGKKILVKPLFFRKLGGTKYTPGPLVNLVSSNLKSVQYTAGTENLIVNFVKGKRPYLYKKVPKHIYENLLRAISKGEFFEKHIRHTYSYVVI